MIRLCMYNTVLKVGICGFNKEDRACTVLSNGFPVSSSYTSSSFQLYLKILRMILSTMAVSKGPLCFQERHNPLGKKKGTSTGRFMFLSHQCIFTG